MELVWGELSCGLASEIEQRLRLGLRAGFTAVLVPVMYLLIIIISLRSQGSG